MQTNIIITSSCGKVKHNAINVQFRVKSNYKINKKINPSRVSSSENCIQKIPLNVAPERRQVAF